MDFTKNNLKSFPDFIWKNILRQNQKIQSFWLPGINGLNRVKVGYRLNCDMLFYSKIQEFPKSVLQTDWH